MTDIPPEDRIEQRAEPGGRVVQTPRVPRRPDPLVEELKRVGSDLTFRQWARHRIKFVAGLVIFDMAVSIVSVLALLGVHHAQVYACEQVNNLRSSYVAQWQPVLDQPPAPLPADADEGARVRYQAGLETRQRFQESLDTGFKLEHC